MSKYKIIVMIFVALVFTPALAAKGSDAAIDQRSLPMLVISYTFGLAFTPTGSAEKRDHPLSSWTSYRLLEQNLKELHADIQTKLAFVRQSYVIQPNEMGSEVIGEHNEGTLYVTDPINNVSVVIVSSVSPETTTIFSVDDKLRTTLIYDSVAENVFKSGSSCDPLGQINAIKVLRPGELTLSESNLHWSNRHKRTFELDLSTKKPVLRCLK